MQTFLPYPNFAASARVLDRLRLGKQRVEVLQILRALRGRTRGWRNHPAVRMWRGHESVLIIYGLIVCAEWRIRGYQDRCAAKIRRFFRNTTARLEAGITMACLQAARPVDYARIARLFGAPPWFGSEDVHASHRSNLLRKDPVHYGRFGWSEPPCLPYVWPV